MPELALYLSSQLLKSAIQSQAAILALAQE